MNLFLLTVLEAGTSKVNALADLLSDENLFPGPQMAAFLLLCHMVEGARDFSGISFLKAFITFTRHLNCLL